MSDAIQIDQTAGTASVVPYEVRLSGNLEWALSEGSRHFSERNSVHETLRRLAARLTELQVPYAIAGGMALFAHGLRRFTEGVDLVVTRQGLDQIHAHLEGRGYVPLFSGSNSLRDAESGVRIEFLVAGQFPGDGKPKPVAFPDPAHVAIELGGVRYVDLTTLVELKLASGMTNVGRIKDLADVQEIVKTIPLLDGFADGLHPYVRDKFNELKAAAERSAHESPDV